MTDTCLFAGVVVFQNRVHRSKRCIEIERRDNPMYLFGRVKSLILSRGGVLNDIGVCQKVSFCQKVWLGGLLTIKDF